MKPSERIRELAEAGETHPFLIGNQARLDAIVAYLDERHAAAVPAGNQAKAPTALDEMRALQEGAQREPRPTQWRPDMDCSAVTNGPTCGERNRLSAELDQTLRLLKEAHETIAAAERDPPHPLAQRCCMRAENGCHGVLHLKRELARVEAERDELRRKLALYSAVVDAAEDVTCPGYEDADWYEPLAAALAALPLEAASEAEVTCKYCGESRGCAENCVTRASEAEVPATSPQELIERFALCRHDIQMHTCPKCRPVPASEAEVTPAVCGKWITDAFLQDCGLPHGHSGACQSRVSDPEATESATKETTQ